MTAPTPPQRHRHRHARWWIAAGVVLLGGLAPAWAKPALAAPIPADAGAVAAEATTLVAVADEWCPYTCAEAAPQPGYLVDILRAAFEPLGYRIEYRVLPWTRALRETLVGRADMALGATPENAGDLLLPRLPAGRDESSFAVRRDSPWRYGGVGDLEAITLGVTADYTYFPEVDDWIARHRHDPLRIDVATGESPLEGSLRKLQNGRIDAFIENRNVLLYAASRHRTRFGIRLEGRIAGSDIVIGFSPATPRGPALVDAFDARLRELRASGELAAILARYGLDDWAKGTSP